MQAAALGYCANAATQQNMRPQISTAQHVRQVKREFVREREGVLSVFWLNFAVWQGFLAD